MRSGIVAGIVFTAAFGLAVAQDDEADHDLDAEIAAKEEGASDISDEDFAANIAAAQDGLSDADMQRPRIIMFDKSGFRPPAAVFFLDGASTISLKNCGRIFKKTSNAVLFAPGGWTVTLYEKFNCFFGCKSYSGTYFGVSTGFGERIEQWDLKRHGIHDNIRMFNVKENGRPRNDQADSPGC